MKGASEDEKMEEKVESRRKKEEKNQERKTGRRIGLLKPYKECFEVLRLLNNVLCKKQRQSLVCVSLSRVRDEELDKHRAKRVT